MTAISHPADPPSTNRLPLALVAALAGVLGVVLLVNLAGRDPVIRTGAPATAAKMADPSVGVTLNAELPGHPMPQVVVPHTPGSTVLDALHLAAQRNDHWKFAYRGSEGTAFLLELGDQANEAGAGRYWQYELNGQHGQRGMGEQMVQPGDQILWKFAPYE